MKSIFVTLLVMCLFAGAVVAQEETATPAFGSVLDQATIGGRDAVAATPEAGQGSDARLTTCAGPTVPGFVPYIIRAGDRLGDLLTGVDNVTVQQLAQLNCLDDPSALPVGAVIWVPRPSTAGAAVQAAATSEVTDEEPVASGQTAAIQALEANAETVPNQEGVTFSWRASGVEAYFYTCPADPEIECRRPIQAQPLPLDHAVTVRDFPYAGPARFRLDVVGAEQRLTQDIAVTVECSHELLGLMSGFRACPDAPPMAVFAAWQPFEKGVMIYLSDTQEIYVMTNADNRVQVFQDMFVEGTPETAYADVPEGRVPARRGFGVIWDGLGGPQSPLGWGLDEEIGFDTARQPAGRVSFTTYLRGPGNVVYAITLVPDTGEGYWTQVKG